MHLALLILLISLATNLVQWIGKTVLIELAFSSLYAPVFLRSLASRQRALKSQILKDKAQLQRTSSQDEFAKWAKLRRNVDKGLKDLEGINAQLQSHRAGFGTRFGLVLTLLTTGAQFVLAWYWRSRPVFWLPKGWVPGVVGWWLRFGGGPKGSISVTAWSVVCSRTIRTGKDLLVDFVPSPAALLFPIFARSKVPTAHEAKVLAQPVPAAADGGEKAGHAKSE